MSRATIERFYAAFAQLDGEAMQACYAPDARFDDEAFSLQGADQIGGMWRMLCTATKSKPESRAHWQLAVSQITDRSAHWEAHYLFSATGRQVINRIDAAFEFDAQGRITRHRDRFDFWAWSRQALGTPGLLLGWTPMLRKKVRATAAQNLARFMAGPR
ncbi:ketosteroid isomerase [beta proteobacterium AAP121]|nr:ketosteroid isomerase [beta proteobacterium AAP65]KPF99223.1 ketosteroid isomerase [beta proteobacterium AAP121]